MKSAPWLLLVLSLPTANASGRMRYWRALKALGCGALRDGVYLLPDSAANRSALQELADGIVDGGGSAQILRASSQDAAQEALFRELFDRSEEYAEFQRALAGARRGMAKRAAGELGRLEQRLRRDLEAVRATDHFPGDAAARAEAAWIDFQSRIRALVAPDEPHPSAARIERLDPKDYQGRTWATRERLWVDRVASAWLIRRFVDRAAKFAWLKKPADCPKKALGFDFDGAAFTHVGERVSFEVLAASFGLDHDPGLKGLGALVHSLDVGEGHVAEAAGFEALLSAARKRHASDDELLAAMTPVLDSLHEFYTQAAAGEKAK